MAGSKKISELTSLTSVSGDDLLVIVDDPSGTATTKKVTVNTFLSNASIGKIVANASVGSANQILSSNGSGIYWSSDLNISTINVASGALYANSSAVYAANIIATTINASANVNTTTFYGNVVSTTVNASANVNTTTFYGNVVSTTVNASANVNTTTLFANVSAGYVNVAGQVNTSTLYVTTSANVGTSFLVNATALVHTGYANVATSVNSALLTVGTSFIANSTGAYHTGTINAASYTVGTIGTSNGFIANSTYLSFGNSVSNATITANSLSLSSVFSVNKVDTYNRLLSIPTANTSEWQAATGGAAQLRTGTSGKPAPFVIQNHISDFTGEATTAGQVQTYLDPVGVLGWNITAFGALGVVEPGMPGFGLGMEYDYYSSSLAGQVTETYFTFITEPLPKNASADTTTSFRCLEWQNIMEKQKSFNIIGISSTGTNTSIVIDTTGTHPNYSILGVGETLHIAGIAGTYSTALNGKKLRLIDRTGTFGGSVTLVCDFTSSGTYTSGGTVTFYPQGRNPTNMRFHAPLFQWFTGDFNENYLQRKRDDSADLSDNNRRFAQLTRGGLTLYQVEKNNRVDLNIGDQTAQEGTPFTFTNWAGGGISIGPNGGSAKNIVIKNETVDSQGVQGYLEVANRQLFDLNSGIYGYPTTPTIRIPGGVGDSVIKEVGNSRSPALWAHAGDLPAANPVFIVSPGSSTSRTPSSSTQGADRYIVRFDARTAVWNSSSPPPTHKTYLTNEGWWFIGNSVSTPSINPVDGGYLYVDASGNLIFKTKLGNVRTVAAV